MSEAKLSSTAGADAQLCRCGCGLPGAWLATGCDYDPTKKGGIGAAFVDEPMCHSAASYCSESADELGLPFTIWRAPENPEPRTREPSSDRARE
jgi:hypothetical protein